MARGLSASAAERHWPRRDWPARGDGQRPLVVVERVDLRREKQRVVVPQLQQVNEPQDGRNPGDAEESYQDRRLTTGDFQFARIREVSAKKKGRSSYEDTTGQQANPEVRMQKAECRS